MVIGTVKHRIQGKMECVNQLYRQVPGYGLKTNNTFYEFMKVGACDQNQSVFRTLGLLFTLRLTYKVRSSFWQPLFFPVRRLNYVCVKTCRSR
jgi:hypothetical protein